MPLGGGEGGTGTAPIEVANYSALPPAGTAPGQTYIVLASQGTKWVGGLFGGTYYGKGYYYDNGTSYTYSEVPYQASQATVNSGTNTDEFVTSATLKNSTQWNTKEDSSNKSTSTSDSGSTTKFPVWSAVVSYVTGLGYLLASTAASTYLTITNAASTFVALAGSYANPSWITSLAWSKITSASVTYIIDQRTDIGSVTGTTSSTAFANPLTIPANTLGINDSFRWECIVDKTGTAGTMAVRVYINTVNSLSGATLIGGVTGIASTNLYMFGQRTYYMTSATNLYGYGSTTTNNLQEVVISSSNGSNITIDPTVINYIIFAGQLGSASDTLFIKGASIMNRKKY
jgi:hypothetical protein